MRHLIASSLIILAAASAGLGEGGHRQDAPRALHKAGEGLAGQHAPQQVTPWWSDRTTMLIGAIGGPILGCLGGLLGTLGGMGKARRFVLGLSTAIVWLGVAALVAGVVALFQSQPYAVWYPLLLLGAISVGVMGPVRWVLRLGYEQRELRKMAALDAGTSRARGSDS